MSANIKKISIAPFMIGLLALVLGGCATTTTNQPGVTKAQVQAAKDREKIRALQTYRKRLQRVHDVAFPLLAASAGLTDKNKTWSYGILFESLVDYRKRDRKFAKRAFPELTDTLTISHVIKGSPAETSGLMVGDVLEEYNGKKITKPNDLENAFKPLRSKERPGPGRFVVERGGKRIEVSIEPEQIAGYQIILLDDAKVDASVGADSIYLTYGVLAYAENDDDLALVLAHQLAHHVAGHLGKARLTNAMIGVPLVALSTGLVAILTPIALLAQSPPPVQIAYYSFEWSNKLKFFRGQEMEADYVGTYIAARAVYAIDGAADFWSRFPPGVDKYYSVRHRSGREKIPHMKKVISEIKEKQANGLPLVPERK